MADEKKQASEINDIKTVDDESMDEMEQKEVPVGGIKRLIKKFMIPGVIGLAALLLALVVPRFFHGGEEPQKEVPAESASDSVEVETINRDSLLQAAARPLELNELDAEELDELLEMRGLFDQLDTTAILEEMGMMGQMPEVEPSDSVPMVEDDSSQAPKQAEQEAQRIAAQQDSLQLLKEEIKVLNNKVTQASNKLDQAEAARITKLARLYDGMKPAEVANLFENLPDSLIVMILPKMKPAHASKILGLMKPKRAASISTKLITETEP